MITLGTIASQNLTKEEQYLIIQFYAGKDSSSKLVHFVCPNTIKKISPKSIKDYLVCTCDAHQSLPVETLQEVDFFAKRPISLSKLKKLSLSIYEQVLKDNWYQTYLRNGRDQRIEFPAIGNTTFFIYVQDIVWLRSDSNLTIIYTRDRKTKIVNIQFNKCLELLPAYNFFRIHKQYIINRKAIVSLFDKEKTTLKLTTGEDLKIARRRINEFKKWWTNKKVTAYSFNAPYTKTLCKENNI